MASPQPAASADHQNRLARETSPYLLQHQHNPVDWWAWGPEALAEAKQSGKPILLSVGYAACHWCHVMAHESFEDDDTARVMNELFVNIKVDREERPDIDQIYMAALHHLGEQGGWPLTMFLTHDAEPIWGGTYFPKSSRYGRPAFVDVLREVARMFREEPQKIEQNRAALMARLAATARPKGRAVIGAAELDNAALQLGGLIDPVNGGTRGAPKFPQAALFELLWRAGLRSPRPNPFPPAGEGREGARFFAAVEITLDHICEGGIYDHLGGGFSRYSVDERWLTPHFEKMLYDNAQLLELLAIAYQKTGKPLYRQRARETVEWLKREMTSADGAFSASLDADSEGEEGKFYVWSYDEVMRELGVEDGVFFARHYDVTPAGNFEGHNILNRLNPQPRSDDDDARLAALRTKLLGVRDSRIRPGLDDKVLADWNGLMIAALANASLLFAEPSWLDTAARAFAFIARAMTRGDRLGHSWREDKLKFPGLASDFAAMIRAALALYEFNRPAKLSRAGPDVAARARSRLRKRRDRHVLSHRRRRRGLGHPPRRHRRRSDTEPQRRRRAKPDPFGVARRGPKLARKSRPADRGDRAARHREPLHARGAPQCRRPAPARRGNRGDRRRRRRRGAARRRARAAGSRPHRFARPFAGKLAAGSSRAGEGASGKHGAGLRLHRRNLLATRDRPGWSHRRGRVDAA